ncbi:MAG: hypothetical protein WBF93_05035 [Pirellulales bacterium]|nr:hypothetical protein [Pirellulales bacterium]
MNRCYPGGNRLGSFDNPRASEPGATEVVIGRLRTSLLLLCCISFIGMTGCDFIGLGGDDTPPPKKRRPQISQPKVPVDVDDNPTDPLAPERSIVLQVGSDKLAIGSCFVKSIPATSRTPMTLVVTSYPNNKEVSYPSFYMRVVLTGNDLKLLLGQRMPARIWFAAQPNDVVFHLTDGQPAEVTIRSMEDGGKITGAILKATLLNTHDKEEKDITGVFTGVLEAMATP